MVPTPKNKTVEMLALAYHTKEKINAKIILNLMTANLRRRCVLNNRKILFYILVRDVCCGRQRSILIRKDLV
jgi:hypothetical protein